MDINALIAALVEAQDALYKAEDSCAAANEQLETCRVGAVLARQAIDDYVNTQLGKATQDTPKG